MLSSHLQLFPLFSKSYGVRTKCLVKFASCLVLMYVVCLQEANNKTHKASKVLILGNMKMLLTTGTSRWNDRQIALWDQVRTQQLRAKLHSGASSVLSSTFHVFVNGARSGVKKSKVLSRDDAFSHLSSGD